MDEGGSGRVRKREKTSCCFLLLPLPRGEKKVDRIDRQMRLMTAPGKAQHKQEIQEEKQEQLLPPRLVSNSKLIFTAEESFGKLDPHSQLASISATKSFFSYLIMLLWRALSPIFPQTDGAILVNACGANSAIFRVFHFTFKSLVYIHQKIVQRRRQDSMAAFPKLGDMLQELKTRIHKGPSCQKEERFHGTVSNFRFGLSRLVFLSHV